MKKLFYIFSVVVAAMTLSACNNLMDENATPNVDGKSNITCTLSAGTRSALDLTDGESVYWTGTEKLGLNYYYTPKGGSEVKFVKNSVYSANAANATTANFTGDAQWWDGEGAAEATHKIYIYYPYSAANDSTTSSNIVGELPAEQEYDATASQWDMSAYDFLYTSDNPATYGEPLAFDALKRLFAVLRLGITNNTGEDVVIKKVTVTSQGGKILAGSFITNISKGRAENALTNRTDAPVKATHGSNTAYGYWTAPESSISTTIANGAVKAGEAIDVRVMINAGYAPSDDSKAYFFDTTTAYLAGDTFTVNIVTDKGAHPEITFTAGALLRGQRAGKSITLDAAPTGGPTILSVESSDSNKDNFYLNSDIIIKGSNLLNVADVKVGGIATEIVSQGNTELVVKMVDCTGAATTKASYAVTYGAGEKIADINIYPFYHYENITLGLGSDSSKTYTDFASQNSFFVPDLGKVMSSKEWYETPIDSYVIDADKTAKENGVAEKQVAPNIALSAKNTLNKNVITEEQYYAVMPYLFFVSFSSHYISMAAPANSDSVLRNHYLKNDKGSFSNMIAYKIWGTPILYYRLAADDWAAKVKEGTVTTMQYDGSVPNSTAPYHKGTGVEGGVWSVGDVLVIGYSSYAKGGKPSKIADCAKLGFIYFKEVTCADLETGLALSPREGHIKFDLYWSKKLN